MILKAEGRGPRGVKRTKGGRMRPNKANGGRYFRYLRPRLRSRPRPHPRHRHRCRRRRRRRHTHPQPHLRHRHRLVSRRSFELLSS